MGRSSETYNKKEVRKKKEKKKKEKEQRRLEKRESGKNSLDDMIAYVDENGNIMDNPPDPKEKEVAEPEDIETGGSQKKPSPTTDSVRKGKVTFFNESKGFGFIEDFKTRERVFLHVSNFREEIEEGNVVNFNAEMGKKGLVAKDVRLFKET
jgi:cold shock CspA family protein